MQKLLSDPKYMELAGKASGQGITILAQLSTKFGLMSRAFKL